MGAVTIRVAAGAADGVTTAGAAAAGTSAAGATVAGATIAGVTTAGAAATGATRVGTSAAGVSVEEERQERLQPERWRSGASAAGAVCGVSTFAGTVSVTLVADLSGCSTTASEGVTSAEAASRGSGGNRGNNSGSFSSRSFSSRSDSSRSDSSRSFGRGSGLRSLHFCGDRFGYIGCGIAGLFNHGLGRCDQRRSCGPRERRQPGQQQRELQQPEFQ